MKTFMFLLLLLPLSTPYEPITDDCKCKGIPLYGKVRIVDAFEDFKVCVVDAFEDLDVDTNVANPTRCGEWEFVDAFEDFTIRYVDAFEDFSIRYVDAFPGQP